MQEINQIKTACSRSSWIYRCFHGEVDETAGYLTKTPEGAGVHWPLFYYGQQNYSLTKQSKRTKSGRSKLIYLAYLYSPAGMSSLIRFR